MNEKDSKTQLDNEDDEISIDLSKIKNIFSRKKSQKKHETVKEKKETYSINKRNNEEEIEDKEKTTLEESKDEEIALSLDSVKNVFSNIKNSFSKKPETSAEEDDSIDLRKVKEVFYKRKEVLIIVGLILIAFFMSFNLRMMPASLPITYEWAENNLNTQIRAQISNQIANEYPNLPAQNREQLVNDEIQKFTESNKKEIEAQKEQLAEFYKSVLQDDNGNTYLLAIDPWFWMRFASNILDHGYPGDGMEDGEQYDSHMIAPLGRYIPPDMFHAYFEAYLYKVVNIFNKNADLMAVAFLVPVILSSLSVIPVFFIARRIGGKFAGFIAAFVVAVHPAFITRTVGGFSDTDAYNIFFPLFITWLFLEAFETKNIKKMVALSSVAGLLVGLYSIAWGGWWYIFDFLLATSCIYLVYYVIIHFKELKPVSKIFKHKALSNTVILILVFILSSMIFVSLFFNFYNFRIAPTQPFNFATIKDVATTTVWPNVFTTVAEQNEASYAQIIEQIGGKLLFYLAIIGIILSIFKKDIFGKRDTKVAILLIIWFSATIYASTKGIRWTLLFVPAFAIALGIFIGILFNYIINWANKELNINKWISGVVLVILFLLLVGVTPIPPFCSTGLCANGLNTAKSEIPSMNDAWFNSLEKIKENSKEDAIITSWWDFGHWFKAIADRPVTFDGTSQGTPMAHWVGKSLLTADEDVSVGILRMLDCGSNNAFEELDKVINKPYKSIDLLNEIIVIDRNSAKDVLIENGLNKEETENVLRYSHCDPPEAFYITSEDMVGKSGVWGHFGFWDFKKATQFNKVRKMKRDQAISYLEQEFNIVGGDADSLISEIKSLGVGKQANDWIAPWPSYASDLDGCNKIDNHTFDCPVSGAVVRINTINLTADLETNEGVKHPSSMILSDTEDVAYKEFDDDNIGFGIILIPNGDSYSRILASTEQTNSIFTRLFYLDGVGLKHFKKFSDETSIFGNHIIIWKVDWSGEDFSLEEIEDLGEDEAVAI